MLRKIEPIEIDREDPWKNDVLDRKKVAEYLTPVLATITQPFVISIDAPYGSGKTTFVRAWQRDLERQGWPSIYFNAWETDISENPILAFMGAFRRQLRDAGVDAVGEAARTEEPPVRRLARSLFARQGLILLGKIAARAAIGSELMKEFVNIGSEDRKDIEAASERLLGTLLDKEAEAQKSVEDFREYLGGVLQRAISSGGKPLVVYIDELDRCRPPYAVQMLEGIKHLFSVRNLVFIIPIDDDYLRSAIGAVYGSKLDATGYLRRFVDWSIELPIPLPDIYAHHLVRSFQIGELKNFGGQRTWEDPRVLAECFGYFAKCLNLSLRDQERAFTHLNLVARALQQNESPLADTLGAFAVLYRYYRADLRNAVDDVRKVEDLLNSLDPRMQTFEQGDIFSDWKRFRPLVHSWFLNEDNASVVRTEFTQMSALGNREGIKQEAQEAAKKRSDYLSEVTSHFHGFNGNFFRASSSAAKITFDRLDMAAKLAPGRR